MTHAGIDFGTSLMKFAWMDGNQRRLVSTDEFSYKEIEEQMVAHGITSATVTGVRSEEWGPCMPFPTFKLDRPVIAAEIQLLARGIQHLWINDSESEPVLVVNCGTGTSYTWVSPDAYQSVGLGNALGGGFLAAMSRMLGFNEFHEFSSAAAKGVSPDLMLRDFVDNLKGTPMYEYLLAHFGAYSVTTTLADKANGFCLLVAVSIVRDIITHQSSSQVPRFHEVLLTGSTFNTFPVVNDYIHKMLRLFNVHASSPIYGRYAGALGAMLTETGVVPTCKWNSKTGEGGSSVVVTYPGTPSKT